VGGQPGPPGGTVPSPTDVDRARHLGAVRPASLSKGAPVAKKKDKKKDKKKKGKKGKKK